MCLAPLFLPPVHLTLSLHTFNQAISLFFMFLINSSSSNQHFLIQSRYKPKSIQNSSSQHAHLFHCSPSRCSDPCGGKSVSVSHVIYVHPTHLADPATSVKSRGVFLMLGRKILSLRWRKLLLFVGFKRDKNKLEDAAYSTKHPLPSIKSKSRLIKLYNLTLLKHFS